MFEQIESKIRNLKCGKSVKIIGPVNMYDCTLGNRVVIGPFCEIQSDVVIGDRSKIQSHTFICSKVRIGMDCFVGHGVMFVNDKFSTGRPAGGNQELWQSPIIGNNVSIGSNATIMPVRICDGTVVGAGAVVTKDISVVGKYAGNPAVLIERLKR